jgi:hypothetical protein
MPGDIDEDGADGRTRRLLRLGGLFLLLLAACVPVVTLHVDRHRPLFVLDEFAYADYLHKIDDGRLVVRHGELSGHAGLRELACRGYEPSTWNDRPPCDAPSYDPAVFPNAGINSADIHPPTYFWVTYLGARAMLAVGASDDLVDGGRLFGAVWMAAGLLALWCLLRAMGAGRGASACGLALVAAGPMLLRQWHYLTPDAANVLVGSLVMLAVVRRERFGPVVLAGAGALAMAVKGPNLIVVVAGGLYLLYRAVRGEAESRRSHVQAFAALIGGAAVTSATWLVVRASLSMPGTSPLEEAERVDSLHPSQVIENVARFITPLDREPSSLYPLALLTSYLLVGYLLVAVVSLSRSDRRYGLALATGTVLIAGPLLLVAVNFVLRGSYAIVEPRYGTTLLPIQAAVAATFWTGRALYAVGALAVVAPLAVLVRLVV